MRSLFEFVGGFVAYILVVGSHIGEEVPFLGVICVLGGIILGRYISVLIEEYEEQKRKAAEKQRWEEQYQKRKAAERQRWEQYQREEEENRKEERRNTALSLSHKYPEATKEYLRLCNTSSLQNNLTDDAVNILLSHSESDYQKFEEELSPKYRAQKEAERQALLQARLRKIEEENSLPACVESWRSHSNSSLKHIYFYDYYPYSKYKENASDGMWEAWRTVWHFKNDPSKNVSCFEHDTALRTITNLVEKALRSAFGTKTEYLTLVCLTASTQRKTELRYKEFADKVCKDLNMTNAYPHIRVIEDGSAKHDGGDGTRQVSYDSYFFKGKNIVLFDDVRTTGNSLEQERRTMEGFGAKVICAITIAQTIY